MPRPAFTVVITVLFLLFNQQPTKAIKCVYYKRQGIWPTSAMPIRGECHRKFFECHVKVEVTYTHTSNSNSGQFFDPKKEHYSTVSAGCGDCEPKCPTCTFSSCIRCKTDFCNDVY
uniref:4Fe-4S ferredoxin-type domain-containing protein n=4 Tax=Macrostomum lignano TaxID=282301 RepID=A0A1I8GI60_9PLAT